MVGHIGFEEADVIGYRATLSKWAPYGGLDLFAGRREGNIGLGGGADGVVGQCDLRCALDRRQAVLQRSPFPSRDQAPLLHQFKQPALQRSARRFAAQRSMQGVQTHAGRVRGDRRYHPVQIKLRDNLWQFGRGYGVD